MVAANAAVGAADCIVAICPKCLLLEWHIFVFAEIAVTGVVSISLIFIIISLELNYPIALSQVVNGVLGFYVQVGLFAWQRHSVRKACTQADGQVAL